jgi:heat shock protein HslJ
MAINADAGATRLEMPLPAPVAIEGGRRYDVRSDAHTVTLTIREHVCPDSLTGMPRPATVEVVLDGQTLKGCGGDPTSLLRGGTWLVSQLGQQPIVKMSRVTLAFGASGRVMETASCNTYSATYLMTAAGLTVTMPIASMRACEAPYMTQEALFLEILRGVNRFELTDGTLTLHATDGGSITARREEVAVVDPKKPAKPR